MTIRTAVEDDAETIAVLSGQLGYPAHPSEVRDRLKKLRARGDGEIFVAQTGRAVAGWVHVYGSHILETPAHAEIGGLVVDDRHRGRGIGRDLMAAAERWAASAGYATVRVRSNVVREAAHEFYRRLGYSETKRQAVFSKTVAAGGVA